MKKANFNALATKTDLSTIPATFRQLKALWVFELQHSTGQAVKWYKLNLTAREAKRLIDIAQNYERNKNADTYSLVYNFRLLNNNFNLKD